MGSKVVLSLALAAVIVCMTSAYRVGGNYRDANHGQYASRPSQYQAPAATRYQSPVSHHYQAPAQKSYVVKYWSEWGHYGACSATCGWGEQRRYRTCLSKREYGYGNSVHQCNGASYSKRRCYGGKPIDGGWSHWSSWATIQGYQQKRTRQCNYPVPSCGGRYCYGSSFETRNVHTPRTYAPAPVYRTPAANTHYRAPTSNTQYRAPVDNTQYRTPNRNRTPVGSTQYRATDDDTRYRAPVDNTQYRAPVDNIQYRTPNRNRASIGSTQYRASDDDDTRYRAPVDNTQSRAPVDNTQYRAPVENTRYRAGAPSHQASYPRGNVKY